MPMGIAQARKSNNAPSTMKPKPNQHHDADDLQHVQPTSVDVLVSPQSTR